MTPRCPERTPAAPRLAALALATTLLGGCGGYGDVSPAAYDYATAIYSVANRESADAIDGLAEQVEAAAAAGEINSQEAQWLQDMLADARGGDWESARTAARRMLEDQIRTTR